MSQLTSVRLPKSTPFPVKVFAVPVKLGETLQKHQTIIKYSYWEFQDVAEKRGDGTIEKKKQRVDLIGTFEAPVEGEVKEIVVQAGEEILSYDTIILKVKEACTHDIQYGGLCAMCGKSVEEEKDYSNFEMENRASISMSHDTNNLKISKFEAEQVEAKMTKNLLQEKKLILVVDLDQTVIHATVDPTIGEWMKDPNNPNYDSLKDVELFSLEEEMILPPHWVGPRPPAVKSWYYVKSRPGLKGFLENISQKYELHIYTMGTRAYAKEIAKIIDPKGKYFADRILSRDESGSLTQKSLERLFPVDTSMVVIIDDRGDVWNWSDHLVKVVPFDFFVGIGDINSNFLPKQRLVLGPTKDDVIAKIEQDYLLKQEKKESPVIKAVEQVEADEELKEELEREASIESQKAERPLAKLQEQLNDETSNQNRAKERLLFDDDDELSGLESALLKIHEIFYSQVESATAHPDIKDILPEMKKKVFSGCSFVFSGLFPTGQNLNKESVVIWSKSFGAEVTSNITMDTTHVITKTRHSHKARMGKSLLGPKVKVVHPNWIFNSLSNWGKLSEDKYEIGDVHPLPEATVEEYKKLLENDLDVSTGIQQEDSEAEQENALLGGDMHWLDIDEEELLSSDEEEEDTAAGSKRGFEDADEETPKKRKVEQDGGDEADDNDDEDDELAAELLQGLDEDDE